MKQILKKITTENMLCLFIILCPILDMSSFIFRNIFNTTISISTFVRPAIPIILFVYIFFKNKFKLKMLLVSAIYLIYALIHLYLFNKVSTGLSCGNMIDEAQYMLNYSFLIVNLFLFTYIFWKKDNFKLQKSILIAFGIYIISIYIAILTNTSSTTYIEGTGYKGWYESGNSLCSILCICMCILIPLLKNRKLNPIIFALGILAGVFLTLLVGTRTGLIGFALVIALYVFGQIFLNLINKDKINIQVIELAIITIVMISTVVILGNSKTFERRKFIDEVQTSALDYQTGEIRHLSGDVTELAHKIENGEIPEEYAPKEVQRAINRLYDYAQRTNMSSSDMRKQQLVYNLFLVQEQNNIPLLLFGNGFKANYSELELEMEAMAFLLNFGLFGFILYFMPFIAIACYGVYLGIKNLKQLDVNYIMYLSGAILAIALSFLSGYTFFNSSSMIIVVAVNTLLIGKINEIQNRKVT